MAAEIPTLRSILEAGGCPVDYFDDGDRQHRVETIGDLLGITIGDRGFRERQIEDCDLISRTELAHAEGPMGERVRRGTAWQRELLTDPELVDLVVASFTDPFEQMKLELRVEISRRPYVFEVALTGGTWSCDACGRCFEVEEAPMIWVGGRADQTDDPDECGYVPSFCADCLEDAVSRARSTVPCST